MAVGNFAGSMNASGIVVSRRKPGHFVALTEDGRIDALIAQGGAKLAAVLEARAPINLTNPMKGSSDGAAPLVPVTMKSIDPYDVAIAMPAPDGEPAVSDMDREVWSKFRLAYDVTLEAPPYKVSGVLLLLSSQDPLSLRERGTDLFIAVFSPTIVVGFTTLKDVPGDSILINRSHLKKVNAALRR
jgi:hypothetical protein